GSADPSLATTNPGFLAADLGVGKITFSASRAAGDTLPDAPPLFTPSASDAGTGLLSNYSVTYTTANFTINTKLAAVSAVANSKTYGSADPALATTNTGFLAADLGVGKITFSARHSTRLNFSHCPNLNT